MNVIRYITMLIICGAYLGVILELMKRAHTVKIDWGAQLDWLMESSGNRLKRNKKKYEQRKIYLSQIGVNYFAKRLVLPEEYLLARLTLAVIVAAAGTLFLGAVSGLFAGVLGFLLPDVILQKMNEKNNKQMLKDIKSIYDTIQIKTQGGMFLTEAIAECYRNVTNGRLKRALYEMSGELIVNHDMEATIDEFNLKFKNKYIDNLCIILKQALDSGKTAEIMESVQDQMTDMQDVINLQVRTKTEKKVFFVEVVIFVTVVLLGIGMAAISAISTISL
ncbi:MAG: hypothetical protein J6J42_03940 [Lachnospiraceae bacterium]|nr:hypothetical protein [Lachnospiraceae bacterium]